MDIQEIVHLVCSFIGALAYVASYVSTAAPVFAINAVQRTRDNNLWLMIIKFLFLKAMSWLWKNKVYQIYSQNFLSISAACILFRACKKERRTECGLLAISLILCYYVGTQLPSTDNYFISVVICVLAKMTIGRGTINTPYNTWQKIYKALVSDHHDPRIWWTGRLWEARFIPTNGFYVSVWDKVDRYLFGLLGLEKIEEILRHVARNRVFHQYVVVFNDFMANTVANINDMDNDGEHDDNNNNNNEEEEDDDGEHRNEEDDHPSIIGTITTTTTIVTNNNNLGTSQYVAYDEPMGMTSTTLANAPLPNMMEQSYHSYHQHQPYYGSLLCYCQQCNAYHPYGQHLYFSHNQDIHYRQHHYPPYQQPSPTQSYYDGYNYQ